MSCLLRQNVRLKAIFAGLGAGVQSVLEARFVDDNMGVSENRLNPIVPNGFADHYPYEKWLFHWEY